jgi:hypothetical protein
MALRCHVLALRYVLWAQDCGEWRAAGGDALDEPPCPVADADLPDVLAGMAALVLAVRLELAGQLGLVGYEEQSRAARVFLQAELEGAEMSVLFAAVDAEADGGGQLIGDD